MFEEVKMHPEVLNNVNAFLQATINFKNTYDVAKVL